MARKRPSRLRQFFAPVFSFLPALRSFRLWPGGGQSVGPVNEVQSYGHIHVTPELALTLSAVWGCVWRYANTISTLPLHLMRTGSGNSATVERTHQLYGILHDRPNPQMSAVKFWQSLIASMMTWGVCYARKHRIGGRLVAMTPMRPEYMTVYMTDAGKLRYRYWPNIATENADLSADDVFVVIDRSMDGYTGLSRIQYAANSLGLAMAGDRAAALSYKNGLRMSGILTVDEWLKPAQREAYREMVQDFAGTGVGDDTDKQFGIFVAEKATKFEPVSLNPQDVELLSSRKFAIEDVCRWYDLPPVLIGHSADGQTMWGTGVEQIILGWLKLGLAPLLRTLESEIWRQLLTPEEQGAGLFAEYNLDALLRGDSAARAAMYSSMGQNGVYTRNEIRARENLPPVPGGDIVTVQGNLVELDQLGKTPADDAVQMRSALRAFLGLDDQPPAAADKGATP